jgi:hypothetical protein
MDGTNAVTGLAAVIESSSVDQALKNGRKRPLTNCTPRAPPHALPRFCRRRVLSKTPTWLNSALIKTARLSSGRVHLSLLHRQTQLWPFYKPDPTLQTSQERPAQSCSHLLFGRLLYITSLRFYSWQFGFASLLPSVPE